MAVYDLMDKMLKFLAIKYNFKKHDLRNILYLIVDPILQNRNQLLIIDFLYYLTICKPKKTFQFER